VKDAVDPTYTGTEISGDSSNIAPSILVATTEASNVFKITVQSPSQAVLEISKDQSQNTLDIQKKITVFPHTPIGLSETEAAIGNTHQISGK